MAKRKQLDYENLDPDQKLNAQKVYLSAEKYGLNPDFVLPLVYAESGFKHIKQIDGPAFGVMQIEPDTAKRMKCDRENLEDNIDCGMKLIKSHVDNPKIGNDPYKVIAAYNTRSDTLNTFLDAYNKDPEHPEKHLHLLPAQTRKHMGNIEDFHGGELPDVTFGAPEQHEGDKPSAATVPEKIDTLQDFKKNEIEASVQADVDEKKRNAERLQSAGLGLLGGTAAGTTIAGVQGARDIGSSILDAIINKGKQASTETAPSVTTTAETAPPSEPVDLRTSGEKWNKTGYGVGEGTVRDVSTRFKRIAPDPASKIARRNFEKFGSEALRKAQEAEANKAFWAKHHAEVNKLNAAQAAAKEADKASQLAKLAPVAEDVTKTFPFLSNVMKYGSYLKYPVMGGLTGLGVGFGVGDTMSRLDAKDKKGAALAGTGTALSAITPFLGGLAGLSTGAVGAAIPLYLAAGDRLEHLKRHPEDYELAPNVYDPQGNFTGFGNP